MQQRKDLEYYMSLDYPVEIGRVSEEDGGGYSASIPSLGRYTFTGDGKTVQEAYEDLEKVKRDIFAYSLEEGIPIPEPVSEEEDLYSGKLLLRMPKRLHAELAEQAKKNGTSLNQYINYLLAERSTEERVRDIMRTELASTVPSILAATAAAPRTGSAGIYLKS